MSSRQGKHKDGNVLIGAMVSPEKKAIAIIICSAMASHGREISQSDLIWEGILRIGQSVGVLDSDGNVTDQFKASFDMALDWVRASNRSNRGTRGGKRSK